MTMEDISLASKEMRQRLFSYLVAKKVLMSRPKGSKNKKMDDQNIQPEQQEEVTDVAEEVKKDDAVQEVVVDDRSAYNCKECNGEGLINNALCANCGGTGKI